MIQNYQEEYEEQRLIDDKHKVNLTTFIFWITLLSAVGGFLFGYDTGIVSGALLFIADHFNLGDLEQEWVVSVTILGAWMFSIVAGYLSDTWGRKITIMISSVIFTLGSILMAVAWNFYALLAGRFIVGAGIGLSSMTVPIYISELSPQHVRGKMTICYNIFVTGGQFCAALISGIFSSNPTSGWRWMLGLPAILALIQFFGSFTMPESHRWLIRRGRYQDAIKVLRKIRDSDVKDEFEKIQQSCLEQERENVEKRGSSFFEYVYQSSGLRKALFIGCFLQMIQQFSGINTVMYYSATIINMSGAYSKSQAVWWAAATAAVNFLGTLIGLALVEKIGRRLLVLISLGGVILSIMVLALGFHVVALEYNPVTFHDNSSNLIPCNSATSCQICTAFDSCGYCYSPSQKKGACLIVDSKDHSKSKDGWCKEGTKDDEFWAFEYCPSSKSWIIILGLGFYLLTFSPGMGPMPWTINSEIFPLWARSACFSMSTSINWLSNLLVSLTFLTLVKLLDKAGVFWLYFSFALIGWIIFFIYLPETKNKSLEEIELLFESDSFGLLARKFNQGKYSPISGVDQNQSMEADDSDMQN